MQTAAETTTSFAADLTKSFAISTVTTVGMVVGMTVVGAVMKKWSDRSDRKLVEQYKK